LNLREAVFTRHSIRKFKPDQVEEEKIMRVLAAANQAPSAGNLQARDFIVVRDEGRRKEVARAALNQGFVAEAPVVIVVCANQRRSSSKYGRRGAGLYCILDAALAAENLMLSCADEGLGSCYVGAFDERRLKKVLAIPRHITPVGIIPIGYPDEEPEITGRLALDRIVHREVW